jgi:hypothetical protein
MSSGCGGVRGEGTELGSPPAQVGIRSATNRETGSPSSEAVDAQPANTVTAQLRSAGRRHSRPGTNLQSTRFYCLRPPPTRVRRCRIAARWRGFSTFTILLVKALSSGRESAMHRGKDRKLPYFWGAGAS